MIRACFRAISLVFREVPIMFIGVITLDLAYALISPAYLVLIQQLVDSIIIAGNRWGVILFLLLFVLLCEIVCVHLSNCIYTKMEQKFTENLSNRILSKLMRLEFSEMERKKNQTVLHNIREDPARKIFFLAQHFVKVIASILTLVFTAFIFSSIHIELSLMFILLSLLRICCDFNSIGKMNDMFAGQTEKEHLLSYYQKLFTDKSVLYELKLFNASSYFLEKHAALSMSVLKERLYATLKNNKYYMLSTLISIMLCVLTTAWMVISMQGGLITIGLFLSVISSFKVLLDRSTSMCFHLSEMSRKYPSLNFFDLFMNIDEMEKVGSAKIDEGCDTILEFRNVSFRYPDATDYALKNVSFVLHTGERLALVGANGSGKSTVIKLICRLFKPTSGEIYLFGKPLNDLPYEQLQKVISVIFQDFVKYQMSIAENIAFSPLKDASNESIRNALSICCREEFPYSLEHKLGNIDKDSVNLSEGQWQSIALARVMYANGSLLMLDEPSASLDPIAESRLYNNFATINKGKSCILVTHRLSSVKLCNQILVLDQGSLVEEGTHIELMNNLGLYYRMFQEQSKWYR